jgi:hypothetical protein
VGAVINPSTSSTFTTILTTIYNNNSTIYDSQLALDISRLPADRYNYYT